MEKDSGPSAGICVDRAYSEGERLKKNKQERKIAWIPEYNDMPCRIFTVEDKASL